MDNTTIASGGGAVIAGAIIVILHYVLSFWNITLPPDVDTALTVIIYFLGHMALHAKLVPPLPAAAVLDTAPAPAPQPMAPLQPRTPPAPPNPPIAP